MKRVFGCLLLIFALLATPVGVVMTHGPDAAIDLVDLADHGHSHEPDHPSNHDPFDHEHHAEAAMTFHDVGVMQIVQSHATNVVLVLRSSVVDDFPRPPRRI